MNTLDAGLSALDHALRTLFGSVHAARPNPALASGPASAAPSAWGAGGAAAAWGGAASAARPASPSATPEGSTELSDAERQLSGALMRVNHVGEVCAQALYEAQALTARTPELRQQMRRAAAEETDHLAWTRERLAQLGSRPSLLNPLWYAGAFTIGLVAGRLGDATSLGFVAETERQVEQHLAGHLERLPEADAASRAIVQAMKEDESRHADEALSAGAAPVPEPVKWAMRAAARVMTTTAHHI